MGLTAWKHETSELAISCKEGTAANKKDLDWKVKVCASKDFSLQNLRYNLVIS